MHITKNTLMEAFQDESLELNATARMVLMAYANNMPHGDKVKEAWPSINTVATFAGISRDSATKYIAALEADGWLVAGEKHKSTKYNHTQGYFLGMGRVNERVIKRRGGFNSGNLVQSNADSVGEGMGKAMPTVSAKVSEAMPTVSAEVSKAMPTEDPKPCRQNTEAMPTEQASHADSVGKNYKGTTSSNYKKNYKKDSAGAPSMEPTPSEVKERYFKSIGLPAVVPAPLTFQDLALPLNVGTKTLPGEKMDYDAVAKNIGGHFLYRYEKLRAIPNLGKKTAFKIAREQVQG